MYSGGSNLDNQDKTTDLFLVITASELAERHIRRDAVVVYESTICLSVTWGEGALVLEKA